MSLLSRKHNFKLAYQSLRAAKGRNFLTMLGIIIGVMAVILIVCVGEGIKHQISGQLGRYGKQVFAVQSSIGGSGGVISGLGGFSSSSLTENDLTTVQQTPGVQYGVPLTTASGSMTGDNTVHSPFIVATTADFPQVIKQSIAYGGFFDTDTNSKTVVLGSAIAHKLYDNNAPLGQSLTWRGQNFVVAGVFDDFAAAPFSLESNFDNAVFVPYSTAQSLSKSVLGIYQIFAKAQPGKSTVAVAHTVQQRIATAHGGASDIQTTETLNSDASSAQTVHLLTVLVYIAATVALIVGGIGIMNVMLVSVTERMHEIGLRKAIGATNRQIMRQFMAEAFMLSAVGAVISVILSAIVVGLLRLFTSLQPVLVWQVMVLAPVIAVVVGLFFGSLPALKAARKDPIEALRHE